MDIGTVRLALLILPGHLRLKGFPSQYDIALSGNHQEVEVSVDFIFDRSLPGVEAMCRRQQYRTNSHRLLTMLTTLLNFHPHVGGRS